MTAIINISGYRFVVLDNPHALQEALRAALERTGIKGAVLLAREGINVTLAGTAEQVDAACAILDADKRLADIPFKRSGSASVPHRRLKVRVRAEIIAFDGDSQIPKAHRTKGAPAVSAEQLRDWLSQGRDITLLDARNDYEVESGTFDAAIHLDIKHFRHFKAAVRNAVQEGRLDPDKPLVTFCTGGIRCEKAAPWLLENGFRSVYQLEGGVVTYLTSCADAHWQGNCFVFDERVEVTPQLLPSGAGLCERCQLAVPAGQTCDCRLGFHHHATY